MSAFHLGIVAYTTNFPYKEKNYINFFINNYYTHAAVYIFMPNILTL